MTDDKQKGVLFLIVVDATLSFEQSPCTQLIASYLTSSKASYLATASVSLSNSTDEDGKKTVAVKIQVIIFILNWNTLIEQDEANTHSYGLLIYSRKQSPA